MCHYLNLERTKAFKTANAGKTVTFYKVLKRTCGLLISPYQSTTYVVGENLSSRDSVDLTDKEVLLKEIRNGFHVFNNINSAIVLSVIHPHYHYLKVEVDVDDIVAVGEVDTVVTKLTISRSEYERVMSE